MSELRVEQEIQFDDTEGESAVAWEDLPPEREFFATPYDPPVKTLVHEIGAGELVVQPSFQRYSVWDTVRKSKFVESMLLNIPIPTLFFAEDEDRKVVVDGQQRLTALHEFLNNRYRLKGLEVLNALNGKRFEDLSERQQRILSNRTLRCLLISDRSDSEIRFQVFERLNQGGVPLNAQEVRHCVYRGSFNDLLHDLVREPVWLELLRQGAPHPRMNDAELVLRFFAIRASLPNYSPPLKTLLNDYMRAHRHANEDAIDEFRAVFSSAIVPVHLAFNESPFRRVFKDVDDGHLVLDRALNRAVFDTQMIVMEGMSEDWVQEHRGDIMNEFVVLCLTDQRFIEAVSRSTADKTQMEYRLRRWKEVLLQMGAELPRLRFLP